MSFFPGLHEELGPETALETLVNMGSVFTDENDPFVQLAYDICGVDRDDKSTSENVAIPYRRISSAKVI